MTTLLRGAVSSFPASSRIAPRFCVSISLPGSHRFVLWNECRSSTRLRALVPAVFPSSFFSPSLRPVFVFLCSPQICLKLFPSLVLSLFAYALTVWLVGTVCVFPAEAVRLCFPQLSLWLLFPFFRPVSSTSVRPYLP